MNRLFVAVQHSPPAIGSNLINLGTQACVPSGWVIGPDAVATHAYCVCVLDGHPFRLDGQPGGAAWMDASVLLQPTAFGGELVWQKTSIPTAAWEIIDSPQVHVNQGVAAMRHLAGTPYDWGEILAAAAEAFWILPGFRRLQFIGRSDAFNRAMICTKVAMNVLESCGVEPAQLVGRLSDLYPERLGQALRDAAFCRRVL